MVRSEKVKGMEKVNLHKFTHIPLLKNDTQLKQKSDKQLKKKKAITQLCPHLKKKKKKKVTHLFSKHIVYVQMNEEKKN